jgi:ADP-ribose pyrophosphatase YjhB (NUDIX family)
MSKRFNVRVYGIWLQDGQMLVNEEKIRQRTVIKFPGGGLEWGEGTTDCLKREWKEELGIDITVLEHFYTTDFFVPSAFDDSQVISIYYLVTADLPVTITNYVANEVTYWMPLSNVSEETFTLVIDRKVGELLYKRYNGDQA